MHRVAVVSGDVDVHAGRVQRRRQPVPPAARAERARGRAHLPRAGVGDRRADRRLPHLRERRRAEPGARRRTRCGRGSSGSSARSRDDPDLCPGGTYVQFDLDGLLRADAASRARDLHARRSTRRPAGCAATRSASSRTCRPRTEETAMNRPTPGSVERAHRADGDARGADRRRPQAPRPDPVRRRVARPGRLARGDRPGRARRRAARRPDRHREHDRSAARPLPDDADRRGPRRRARTGRSSCPTRRSARTSARPSSAATCARELADGRRARRAGTATSATSREIAELRDVTVTAAPAYAGRRGRAPQSQPDPAEGQEDTMADDGREHAPRRPRPSRPREDRAAPARAACRSRTASTVTNEPPRGLADEFRARRVPRRDRHAPVRDVRGARRHLDRQRRQHRTGRASTAGRPRLRPALGLAGVPARRRRRRRHVRRRVDADRPHARDRRERGPRDRRGHGEAGDRHRR